MIGIYKIQNKLNGKIYIGQSNNIQRRFQEHRTKGSSSQILLDKAIQKYGADNFSYDIVEECPLEKLNERETYWILFFHSNEQEKGYNLTIGGKCQSQGENNGRTRLTDQDVIEIRNAYNNHLRRRDVYQKYKDKISFSSFAQIWDGTTWHHIMPEVYTKENKEYFSKQTTLGEKSVTAILSDQEVLELRKRYEKETAKEIWEDYKDIIKYQTLQQILWGRTYKHLPIYKKKTKEWINL